ncbi:flagellar protein [Rhizobium tumorigenes]
MKAMDTDAGAKPLTEQKRKRVLRGDTALKGAGLALAALSAFFPWYVFLNPDKFGMQVAEGERTRALPSSWEQRNVFSVSPMGLANSNETDSKPPLDTDQLTTATTGTAAPADVKGADAENQPFPGVSDFRLLHVSNGRALIQDAAGMYVVRIGSVLPDNSRLSRLEQRKGKWVMITSTGAVYDAN